MAAALLDEIQRWKKVLEDDISTDEELTEILKRLDAIEIDRSILAKTKIGVSVSRLKQSRSDACCVAAARKLVEKWKAAVVKPVVSQPRGTSDSMNDVSDWRPASLNREFPGPKCGDLKRNKAREILFKALLEGLPEDQLQEVDTNQAGEVVALVEDALYAQHMRSNNLKEYQAQMRTIKSNLSDRKNPEFNIRLIVGAITPEQLAVMPSLEMASDAKKRERQKAKKDALEACQSDWDLRNVKRAAGQFPCGKCRSDNTSYFQIQTRSADEPMTTFVNCSNCGHRWKF